MQPVRRLMNDLEESIADGSPERRESTLWQITDLLLVDIDRLTDEQIEIFDGVIARLAKAIETEARAALARRLASVERAPPALMRSLAHDTIEVARPVLARSPRLNDGDLIAVAIARSPEHRQAIAQRQHLNEPVTDTLLARADRPILHTLAANPGARFSDQGVRILVDMARLDEELQALVETRADLPAERLERLFSAAERTAREHLGATTPSSLHGMLEQVFSRSSKRVRAALGAPLDYGAAMDTIGAIEIGRPIDEEDVAGFAKADQLEETICAMVACTGLTLAAAERLFTVSDSDLLLILGRAKGWSWKTVEALLAMKHGGAPEPALMKRYARTFSDLDERTAQRVLRFLEQREKRA